MSSHVSLGNRRVGPGEPCFVVAEIAQAHDGSLGAAHAYVDAVARAGACAVKFQTHIAAAESTRAEPWRVKFSRQDETRYDYWRRMELTEDQWLGLAEHAREAGLVFLSSPFSMAAADLLERVGMPAWKVASGEVGNLPLVERLARTGNPVILSSGLSSWAELDAAVSCVREHRADLAVLQCTTSYPTPPERIGLNVMQEIRDRYGCPTGLSDHSSTVFAGLAAATLGADILEVHVTFSRECFGPDTSSSLTTAGLAELVRGVRFVERALSHPMDKDAAAAEAEPQKRMFGKSVVAARDLSRGHVIEASDVALKKPGTGIPAARVNEVLGRVLRRALSTDAVLCEDDLEPR